ncbi:MAG TPA: hypothetical protein VIF62_15180 [Labilithrix sp.]
MRREFVMHDVLARDAVRMDLYLPVAVGGPVVVWMHDRAFPAPDDGARDAAAAASELQRRGIAVITVTFDTKPDWPLRRCGEQTAEMIRDLFARKDLGLTGEPILAGEGEGARLAALLALDEAFGLHARGVIGMSGAYEGDDAPIAHVRKDAPPMLLLSAHAETPRAARSTRVMARALERAGANVRAHHLAWLDESRLANLSGDRNDVVDLVAAFVRGDATPGAPDGAFVVGETWSRPPLTSEGLRADEQLVVRKPVDAALRSHLTRIMTDPRDLDPWPLATYDAIDLSAWLTAHRENGAFVTIVNARGEEIVLRREDVEKKKPEIVVGIDDERNLFRMYVTYNVYRTYSWKPEPASRPLLVRPVGAFVHGLDVATGVDFALTAESIQTTSDDPLAKTRAIAQPLAGVLGSDQGCLQCHAMRGKGPRAHHLRARDGQTAEAYALPLEEYPSDVMRRFLFDQDEVAKSFGVGPIRVPAPAANQLLAEIRASSP